jgi:tetratricopeptide (TPR) repeat protein
MGPLTSVQEPVIGRQEILAHLQQLLTDRRFALAERNASFLRFVVESTLNGKAGQIKETVIATEVYGRPSDYDPKADSIVRVEATRLRQKLRSYYENEGKDSAIRLHLPSGSYVPSFERLDEPPVSQAPASEAAPGVSGMKPIRKNSILAGAAVSLLTVLLFMQVTSGSKTADWQRQEALAAWREGIDLMALDPHSAQTVNGPPGSLLRAIERLEFAVARNPSRAQTWASLAEAYDYASAYAGRDLAEDGHRMETAADRAIALDAQLAAGHHMRALFLKGIKWDFANAELSYKRALQLDPQNAYAVVEYTDLLRETGRIRQAAEEIRKARALLPGLPVLAVKEAEIQLDMGRTDAALATARSAVELQQTYLRAHVALGMAYERKGDREAALARYEHVLEVNPSDRRALPAYGYLLAKMGETAQARAIADRLEKMNSTVRNCAFQVAVVYAGFGEDELALSWLEKAWRTRQSQFPFAAAEYRFRRFHENARFRELLGRVGLKPLH